LFIIGSQNYAAPEIMLGYPYDGTQTDMWSCGVVLFVLISMKFPFTTKRGCFDYTKAIRGAYTMPSDINTITQDIIRKLFQTNPITRLTIDDALQHQWFQQISPPSRNKKVHFHKNKIYILTYKDKNIVNVWNKVKHAYSNCHLCLLNRYA
jgi:serine/threonine protein kinase